jgi:hypothetical protein
MKVKRDGKATEQLDKSAFVYDAERPQCAGIARSIPPMLAI